MGDVVASVVIPAHNAAATIGRQLGALCAQTDPPPFEVIVVLNRCTDRTAEVVKEFDELLPLVAVVANAQGSAAYARNVGASHARSDRILYCDADDEVSTCWIVGMLVGLEGADLVGGLILVDRAELPEWAYDNFYAKTDGLCLHDADQRFQYPLGASLGVRHHAFDLVGGFDERFGGAGGEEPDFALRVLRAGFRVGAAPQAHITYAPRIEVSHIVRQQAAYRAGYVARQSRFHKNQPLSLKYEMVGALRRTYRDILERRIPNLDALACSLRMGPARYKAVRRLDLSSLSPYENEPDLLDFMVPIEVDGIGGLGFLSTREMARAHAGPIGVEQATLRIAKQILQPGGTCVEVGANIGSFAVWAGLRVGPAGHVLAIEADPRARRLLQRNIDRHSTTARTRTVSAIRGAENGSASWRPLQSVVDTEICRLDDLALSDVDLIKIDIGGHELDVLRGAEAVLGSNPDASIIVELDLEAQAQAGRSSETLVEFIRLRGPSWMIEEVPAGGDARVKLVEDSIMGTMTRTDGRHRRLIGVPRHRSDLFAYVATEFDEL